MLSFIHFLLTKFSYIQFHWEFWILLHYWCCCCWCSFCDHTRTFRWHIFPSTVGYMLLWNKWNYFAFFSHSLNRIHISYI
jgi:hypothetical protein